MNVDVIGTIYTGGTYDSQGNVVTAPTAQPGYHVNVDSLPSVLKSYVVTPATPTREFAGCKTHYLKFADEAEFKSVMAQYLPSTT